MLLGAGRLVGLQEEGREGVDLVRPPHFMGKQRQLHYVEVFIQVLHLCRGREQRTLVRGLAAGRDRMWADPRG